MADDETSLEVPTLTRRAWHPEAPSPTQAPSDTNLAEYVASQIEKRAAGQEPGTRLGSKDELREAAGVSVGTMNEALRIAQARGGVTLRRGPGGGIFAAPTSSLTRMGALMLGMVTDESTIIDAARMRNALEILVLTDAVENVTEADLVDLRAMTQQLRRSLEAGDIQSCVEQHWAFQARVTSISPNPLMRTVFLSLLGILDEQTGAIVPVGTDLVEELRIRAAIHERMVIALENRDLAAALGVMDDGIAAQRGP